MQLIPSHRSSWGCLWCLRLKFYYHFCLSRQTTRCVMCARCGRLMIFTPAGSAPGCSTTGAWGSWATSELKPCKRCATQPKPARAGAATTVWVNTDTRSDKKKTTNKTTPPAQKNILCKIIWFLMSDWWQHLVSQFDESIFTSKLQKHKNINPELLYSGIQKPFKTLFRCINNTSCATLRLYFMFHSSKKHIDFTPCAQKSIQNDDMEWNPAHTISFCHQHETETNLAKLHLRVPTWRF